MKDLVHHLKHLQKKVITSSRKAEALNSSQENHSKVPFTKTEVSPVHQKKMSNSPFRNSSLRLQVR